MSHAMRTSLLTAALVVLAGLTACPAPVEQGVKDRILATAATSGQVVYDAGVTPSTAGALGGKAVVMPPDLAKLLEEPISEERFYQAVKAKGVSLLLLKRPGRKEQEPANSLRTRLSLALSTGYFNPLYRDMDCTILAPLPAPLALDASQWVQVFAFVRSKGDALPAGAEDELPAAVRAFAYLAGDEVSTDPARSLAAALTALKTALAATHQAHLASEALTLAFSLEPGELVAGDRRQLEELYVKGEDGIVWHQKTGTVKPATLTPLDAMRLNLNGINDVAEQFVTMEKGKPLTPAERRRRTLMMQSAKARDKVEPVVTDAFFKPEFSRWQSLRMVSAAQADPDQAPRRLVRGRYPVLGFSPTDMDEAALRASFLKGARFLLANFKPGQKMWNYEYYPQEGSVYGKRYNIIRHLLACFTMLQAYEITGEAAYLDTARLAIEWVMDLLAKDQQKGICYFSHKVYDNKYKLGGMATLLYAMVEYTRFEDQPQWKDTMTCLGGFLAYMQEDSGEYRSFYYPDGKAGNDKPVTIYPGEADLALTALYTRTGDKKYLKVLEKSYTYYRDWFDDNQDNLGLTGPYAPWAMAAFADLYAVTGEEKYRAYVADMGDWLLKRVWTDPAKVYGLHQFGSFSYTMNPGSYPFWNTGVYAEGLAGAAVLDRRFLPPLAGMFAFIANLQLDAGDTLLMKNPRKAVGCVPEHQYNYACRLDYVYHCMSGMFRILKAAGSPPDTPLRTGATAAVKPRAAFLVPAFPLALPDGLAPLASPYEAAPAAPPVPPPATQAPGKE